MGSKKHKKHHKSEKKEVVLDERQEKPLKLVLKVGGSVQSPVHASNSNSSSSRMTTEAKPLFEEAKVVEKSSSHSHEKHKKSKKKKKKKSTDKDKERHERKRKHHHHHHHHREHSHERKEKRRKEQDSRSLTEGHDSRDSLAVPIIPEPHPIMPMEKPLRDARSCTLKKKAMKSPLQILLHHLLKKLQSKDPQEFFAWPVTDMIAPGYSSIIANPIDFSTIQKKIDDREYKTLSDFKTDIKLMCDNAMTYNRPDTVYYKSARRMWHYAHKSTSRDQLAGLKRTFPYMTELSVDELGFNINYESEESLPGTEVSSDAGVIVQPTEAKKSKVTPCWNSPEPEEDDDEMTPEEILHQAQQAAKAAADRLTLKRPNCKFGFLRQNENGSTTLAIVHPKSGEKEIKVNLEMLAGKVSQGTGTITGFKEDTKNFAKPVHYNNYGSYSSYAPHYDSSFSNLSKEDSDLVLSTYGDELGVQYADSLMSFGRDSDYVINMVDSILDNLTGGEHSKTVKILEERRAMREEEAQARQALKPLNENEINKSPLPVAIPDLDSLQTLEDIEMELNRLENCDENKRENGDKAAIEQRKQLLYERRSIQQKLDNTTQLLSELKKAQNDRLSCNPPPHLALIRQPSAAETDLAERVTKKLIDVSGQLPPENIVSVKGLRKAMGITYHPVPQKIHNPRKQQQQQQQQPPVIPMETDEEDSQTDRMETDLIREYLVQSASALKICTPPSSETS